VPRSELLASSNEEGIIVYDFHFFVIIHFVFAAHRASVTLLDGSN
jgi:hypothetical protein